MCNSYLNKIGSLQHAFTSYLNLRSTSNEPIDGEVVEIYNRSKRSLRTPLVINAVSNSVSQMEEIVQGGMSEGFIR
jgi:hypothetical protein